MKVDLFTLIAQIINFLILVFLLYYFLFRKIIKIMERREEIIRSKIDEANKNKEAAEEEKKKFLQKQEEIEMSKKEVFEKSNKEAMQQKEDFLANARKEIEESQKKWQEEIKKQQSDFLEVLKKEIPKKTLELSIKVLKDLSNESIQVIVVEHFLEKLKNEKIDPSLKEITIESAFEFDDDMKNKILEKVKKAINPDVSVIYNINPELTLGINFQIDGKVIKWDVKSYLENFDKDIHTLFQKIEK